MESPVAMQMPRTSTRGSAYKALYKSFCLSKVTNCFLKKSLNEEHRPGGAGRTADQLKKKGESATTPVFRQERKLVVEKSSARLSSNRLDAGLIPPAPARFRRNTGELSSTSDSALESRKQRCEEGHFVARRRPRQAGFRHAGTRDLVTDAAAPRLSRPPARPAT